MVKLLGFIYVVFSQLREQREKSGFREERRRYVRTSLPHG